MRGPRTSLFVPVSSCIILHTDRVCFQNGTAEGGEPWADIADKLTQAINMYSRATPPADPETNYSFVAWLYTRAVLRHTSLLLAIWASKGWGPLAFSTLLHGGTATLPPTLTQESDSASNGSKRVSYNSAERLTSITGITRFTISSILSQVHGPWLLHLGARERIFILENVAAIYSILGYVRKEAYILREVLGCIMDLVVCGRDEEGPTAIAGAGLGIQGVDLGENANRGSVGIRTNDNAEGNQSIVRVVKHICRIHGVDLEAVRLVESDIPENDASVESDDVDTVQEAYGWPELQIGIVREAIAVAEALPGEHSFTSFTVASMNGSGCTRLSSCCAVLLVFAEDIACCNESGRPASSLQHSVESPCHSSAKRRLTTS